jgi:hypothetical protein
VSHARSDTGRLACGLDVPKRLLDQNTKPNVTGMN